MIQGLDCIGRGNLREVQMAGVVQKIKKLGLLYQEPPACEGRGIVIAGGGKYVKHAWAVAAQCRELGWTEGIQVWHLGAHEVSPEQRLLFQQIDVELVDCFELRRTRPMRILTGWESKIYIVMNCPWRHVMYLDADCVPDCDPAEIFNHKEVAKAGSLFFSDVGQHHKTSWAYAFCGLKRDKKEWESGQFVVDKQKTWMGLRWVFWMCEHSDVWFKLGHGDKLAWELGIRMAGVPHLFSTDSRWQEFGIGQYWDGKRFFKHWMKSKRMEAPFPPEIQRQFDRWDALTTPSPTVVGAAPAVA